MNEHATDQGPDRQARTFDEAFPNITFDEALKKFPDECRAVLETADWNLEKISGPLSAVNLYGQLGCTGDRLLIAALRWLEGKELVCLGPTTSHRRFMPRDAFRWALEEVREQLK